MIGNDEISRKASLIDDLTTGLLQRLAKPPFSNHPHAGELYRLVLENTHLRERIRDRFVSSRRRVLDAIEVLFAGDHTDVAVTVDTIRYQLDEILTLDDGMTPDERELHQAGTNLFESFRAMVLSIVQEDLDLAEMDRLGDLMASLSPAIADGVIDEASIDIVLSSIERSSLHDNSAIAEHCSAIRRDVAAFVEVVQRHGNPSSKRY